jgi:hypothetical protein
MDDEELDRLKKELESAYSSPMQAAMAQLHEMYLSLKRAGFTRKEALFMVSRLFNEMTLGGMDSDKRD